MLPFYTRHLSPADYGLVALVTTLTSLVMPFMGLQLANSLRRLYFDYEGKQRVRFISTVFLANLAIGTVLFLLLNLGGDLISRRVFPEHDLAYRPYLVLGFVTLFCRNQVNFFNALLRVEQRGIPLLVCAVFATAAGILGGIYFIIVREMQAVGLLAGTAVQNTVYALMLTVVNRRILRPRFDVPMLRSALRYSLPIVPHSFGIFLVNVSDRYVASLFVSTANLGLYDFAHRIAMVFKLGVVSFHNAYSPSFMAASKADKTKAVSAFAIMIERWAAGISIVFLGMALFSEDLLLLFIPANYLPSYTFIPILLTSFLFRGLHMFAIDSLLYEKKTRWLPAITTTTGVLNIGLNVLLIPRFGILAAAWVHLACFIISFLVAYALSSRWYRLNYRWAVLLPIFAWTALLFFAVQAFAPEAWAAQALLKAAAVLGQATAYWILNVGRIRESVGAMIRRH